VDSLARDAKGATTKPNGLLCRELVGRQFVLAIKMKGRAGGDRLERLRIDVVNRCGYGRGVRAIVDGESLGVQIENHPRFGSAGRQLGIEHFVNLAQPGIRSVATLLAAGRGKQRSD